MHLFEERHLDLDLPIKNIHINTFAWTNYIFYIPLKLIVHIMLSLCIKKNFIYYLTTINDVYRMVSYSLKTPETNIQRFCMYSKMLSPVVKYILFNASCFFCIIINLSIVSLYLQCVLYSIYPWFSSGCTTTYLKIGKINKKLSLK